MGIIIITIEVIIYCGIVIFYGSRAGGWGLVGKIRWIYDEEKQVLGRGSDSGILICDMRAGFIHKREGSCYQKMAAINRNAAFGICE